MGLWKERRKKTENSNATVFRDAFENIWPGNLLKIICNMAGWNSLPFQNMQNKVDTEKNNM